MKFISAVFSEDAMTRGANYCYGVYKDYYISLEVRGGYVWVAVQIQEVLSDQIRQLQGALGAIHTHFPKCRLRIQKGFIEIQRVIYLGSAKEVEEIENCLDEVVNLLTALLIETGCVGCGVREQLKPQKIKGVYMHICPECSMNMNRVNHNVEKIKESSPVIPGLIGTILGRLR